MPAKLQHYVQQFYLKAFADPENPTNLWIYDKQNNVVRSQGIKNTAAETYYYSLKGPDGSRDDLLDRDIIDKVENQAVAVIRNWRMARRPLVRLAELEPMARYLAVSYVRSPRARSDSRELITAQARRMLLDTAESDHHLEEFVKTHPECQTTKAKVREALLAAQDPERISLTPSGNAVIASPFLLADEIAPPLVLMNWSFLESPENISFVTSDSPVSVYAIDGDGGAHVGVGFGLPNVEITFPLSPRVALRLSWRRAKSYQRIAEKETLDINLRAAAQAARYVYSSQESEYLQRMVQYTAAREPERRVLSHGPVMRFQKFPRDL